MKRQIVGVVTVDALEVANGATRTARVKDFPDAAVVGGMVALCADGRARCVALLLGVIASRWMGALEDEMRVVLSGAIPVDVEIQLGDSTYFALRENEIVALRTQYSRFINLHKEAA
ncbi:MAG: hypothetical protein HC933_00790 [Pleurocapsa sp. SU_196_0]|nr:hypothetical protein [Pleurocapsa sp. SU_196_0]